MKAMVLTCFPLLPCTRLSLPRPGRGGGGRWAWGRGGAVSWPGLSPAGDCHKLVMGGKCQFGNILFCFVDTPTVSGALLSAVSRRGLTIFSMISSCSDCLFLDLDLYRSVFCPLVFLPLSGDLTPPCLFSCIRSLAYVRMCPGFISLFISFY